MGGLRYLVRGLGIVVVLLIAACPRTITDSAYVLSVSPPSATLFVDDVAQFSATLRDQDGNPVEATFSWTSSNPGVATVSATGLVRAVASGSATIEVAARGEVAGAAVTVSEDNGQTLTVSPQAASLFVNSTQRLTATLKDRNGNNLPVTPQWSSSNAGVATVTSDGTVKGMSAGSATISAKANNLTASASIDVVARANSAVLVGAGDIAVCGNSGDDQTANLIDDIPGIVFTAGDNAYPNGTPDNFTNCYGASWGRHKARTRPAPGNHEYNTFGAAGYFGYFGSAAGDPAKGYYSYEAGPWHVVVINSNVSMSAGSPQEQWLRADLEANQTRCTLAYWHHPRFSSGVEHGSSTVPQAIWQALYDGGADVVIAAHDHLYERFAPQTPSGELDMSRGIRAFVVGTGGAGLYNFGSPEPNSEVRYNSTAGVLKLTLFQDRYEWRFIPTSGSFTDNGSASCH